MTSQYMCGCRDCRKMARKGKILGSRSLSHLRGGRQSDPERDFGDTVQVSDYVDFPKMQPGKRVRRPNQKIDYTLEIT